MGIPAPAGVAASGQPPAGDKANAVLQGVILAVGPTQPFAFRGPMNLSLWRSVTTTLTVTAGSLAATVASATGLAAGAAINSTLVPKGTTIGALSGTDVTLAIPPITIYGKTSTEGDTITDLDSTDGLLGATVTGDGIPSGTTVTAILAAASQANGVKGSVRLSATPTSAAVQNVQVPFTFARTANAILASGADAAASFTGAAISWSGTVQPERSFDGGATWLVCNQGGAGTAAQYTAGPVTLTFGEPERQVLYRLNCIAFTTGPINYRISETGGAAESLAIGPLT